MLRGYRLLIVAVGGITLLITAFTGAYFGSLYAPDRKDYQAESGKGGAANDYSGPSESLPDIAGLPGPVERAIANPQPTTGKDNEIRDLAAQEASALWAFWIVLFSALSVLVTTVGTILLYKQIVLTRQAVEDTDEATQAMREANEIARDTAKRQLRAYVGVEDATVSNFRVGESPLFKVFAWNRGQTPAYDVRLLGIVVAGTGEPGRIGVRFRKLKEGSRATLAPQQKFMLDNKAANTLVDADHTKVMAKAATLVFGGFIAYTDAFGKRRRTVFKLFMRPDLLDADGKGPLSACARGNRAN